MANCPRRIGNLRPCTAANTKKSSLLTAQALLGALYWELWDFSALCVLHPESPLRCALLRRTDCTTTLLLSQFISYLNCCCSQFPPQWPHVITCNILPTPPSRNSGYQKHSAIQRLTRLSVFAVHRHVSHWSQEELQENNQRKNALQ